jgi:type I pantothenate kinase
MEWPTRPDDPAVPADGRGFDLFTREEWAAAGREWATDVAEPDIDFAVSAGTPINAAEVVEIYVPLSQLFRQRITTGRMESEGADRRRRDGAATVPSIVGITGSVAVGKSATARVLQALLRRGPGRPTVDVLTTDSFLYPNRVLQERGLLDRKGFPETYDRVKLAAALGAIRAGTPSVTIPVYSHDSYDIRGGEVQVIRRPEILIVEGLNVLQRGSQTEEGKADRLSESIDLSVFVDADEVDIARWFRHRLLGLRAGGLHQPTEFLQWFASLTEGEARAVASQAWSEINLVNLRENVAPTRQWADVILRKDGCHRVQRVLVRRP